MRDDIFGGEDCDACGTEIGGIAIRIYKYVFCSDRCWENYAEKQEQAAYQRFHGA